MRAPGGPRCWPRLRLQCECLQTFQSAALWAPCPPASTQAQARLADARDAVAGPLAAASERVRRLVAPTAVAPTASPAAPRLADARGRLPAPQGAGAPRAGEDSWLGSALRPLRDLVGIGSLAQDARERP